MRCTALCTSSLIHTACPTCKYHAGQKSWLTTCRHQSEDTNISALPDPEGPVLRLQIMSRVPAWIHNHYPANMSSRVSKTECQCMSRSVRVGVGVGVGVGMSVSVNLSVNVNWECEWEWEWESECKCKCECR